MLTFFSFLVLMTGTYLVLNPRFHDGVLLKILISTSALCAGAFVLGQDFRALFYCLLSLFASSIVWVSKELIHVVR